MWELKKWITKKNHSSPKVLNGAPPVIFERNKLTEIQNTEVLDYTCENLAMVHLLFTGTHLNIHVKIWPWYTFYLSANEGHCILESLEEAVVRGIPW